MFHGSEPFSVTMSMNVQAVHNSLGSTLSQDRIGSVQIFSHSAMNWPWDKFKIGTDAETDFLEGGCNGVICEYTPEAAMAVPLLVQCVMSNDHAMVATVDTANTTLAGCEGATGGIAEGGCYCTYLWEGLVQELVKMWDACVTFTSTSTSRTGTGS